MTIEFLVARWHDEPISTTQAISNSFKNHKSSMGRVQWSRRPVEPPGPGIIRRNILSTLEGDHALDNERCEVREAEAFKTDTHRLDPYLSAIGCCPAATSAGGVRR